MKAILFIGLLYITLTIAPCLAVHAQASESTDSEEMLQRITSQVLLRTASENPIYWWHIGQLYRNGIEIKTDKQRAIRWFEKAASGGHIIAPAAIAEMYYDGEGVKQDVVKARHYYYQAAMRGYVSAQYNLGVFYINGIGGAQKVPEGIFWLYVAADRCHDLAEAELERLKNHDAMVVFNFDAVQIKAVAWAPEASVSKVYENLLEEYHKAYTTVQETLGTSRKLDSANQIELEAQLQFYKHEIALLESEIHIHFGRESKSRKNWRIACLKWIHSIRSVNNKQELLDVFKRIDVESENLYRLSGGALVDASRFMGAFGPSKGLFGAFSQPMNKYISVRSEFENRFGLKSAYPNRGTTKTDNPSKTLIKLKCDNLITKVYLQQLEDHSKWIRSQNLKK